MQSGDPYGEPGRVERPSWRAGWGREAHPEGWMGLGGPPGGPHGFGRPSHRAGGGREVLPEGREESGGMRRVRSPFWRVRSVWEASRKRLEELAGSPGEPVCIGRPSRSDGSSWESLPESQRGGEALPEGQKGSGVPSAGPGGDTTTTRRAGRERDALPRGQEGSRVPPR